ncbi:Zinc finger CCCH domain-containing protein [Melia azedarach]|uniref:Zinc finger CCCH domain-containing protein n=1 Tax=Melia azedarach TaxID=155640 RepID=A0ACC1YNS3_MELAZ|nr:Zinc finger CCCH domain-containing protein [Melia azedarach]
MCGGSEKLSSNTLATSSSPQSKSSPDRNMSSSNEMAKTEHSFSPLLELAADNDVEGFKKSICDASAISEVGLWYCCQRLSKKIVLECRTLLMVAAEYGSVDVVKLILSLTKADVSLSCGMDNSTALHCAASGGSVNAVDVVKLLLLAGADPNTTDANGHRPFDVIVAHPDVPDMRVALEELLKNDGSLCLDDLQCKSDDVPASSVPEKKEYPIDPSLPDIQNSMYTSDEFRMFSFKIRPCSRAYSHDWTECPFAHPGENAKRRDPRKFHYSCVPCPDHRRGACSRGDMCEYAHGIFESWLHPAQYKTKLCKDGTSCTRRVCFFAHTSDELRPLYASTGSGVPSPRLAAAMNLMPGSPSSVSAMPPFPYTPPMSPSNDILHSSMAWPQQSIPTLHLPVGNIQASRLRSSLNARDIPAEELNMLQDFEMQQRRLINELSSLSQPQFCTSSANFSARSNTLTPTKLELLSYAEVSSPRYSDHFAASTVLSPSHKSVVLNQLQQQEKMLSPIKTNVFPPKNVDHSLLQASFGISSPRGMSPRKVEPISPMSSRRAALAQREKLLQQLCNLSCDLKSDGAIGSPVNSWSNLESPGRKVDWSVQVDELNRLRKSYSLGLNGEGPDVSSVQSLARETPRMKETTTVPPSRMSFSADGTNLNPQSESGDHLGAWIEQLQLDQIVA